MSREASVAVIGGTGFNDWAGFTVVSENKVDTPWGEPSAALRIGTVADIPCIFLPRHGDGHRIPPHQINYRANIQGLADQGIQRIIAVAAVGGIRQDIVPGSIALPDQIIDYSWGRPCSFWDAGNDSSADPTHIDFTRPFSNALRHKLHDAARKAAVSLIDDGCYGVTQGPRLETAAEIRRMQQDGCDMVGMTCMPEAALAREAGMEYACIAVSVNRAAGLGSGDIHAEIQSSVEQGIGSVRKLLSRVLPELED